ncbi:Cytochrome P450 3A24 [Halotydeus destructor]|nr:Cytochrome P450 3A24 [Halotydeus destructor]
MLTEIFLFVLIYLFSRLVLWYFNRVSDQKRFAQRGIPGPEPSVFYGNFSQLQKSGELQHAVIENWIAEYGNVFGYYVGAKRHLIVNDLDILQKVFTSNTSVFRNRPPLSIQAKPIIYSVLTLVDEAWRRVRRVISPIFSQNKVTGPVITDAIESCVDAAINRIKSSGNPSQSTAPFEADIYPVMQAFTLDVIARTALNIHTDVHNPDNELLNAVRQYFSEATNIAVELASFFPFLSPLMKFVNDNLTAGKMTDMTLKHIHQQLLETVKNPVDLSSQNFLQSMIGSYTQGNLSKDELIGNIHIILLAGYETTANAVSYTLYMLAKHPEIQQQLRNHFNSDDSENRDYFEMVWSESLRILPPVVMFLVREASEDIVINDVSIEKDTTVVVPVWQLHHRSDLWPEPHQFNPERFSPETRKSIPQMAYLPFGAGSRICLGMQFALHEARLLIKRFVTEFKIELGEGLEGPLKLKSSTVFIHPAVPLNLKFTPIKLE